ncbi:polysaccharide deacetylase family protein [Heyndrickxia faecalis]|uniref:polysaccharide deacetylase family protein n=1 Tax=Heyndrickxia faecalis TaxID=2824910 RepID=UPI001B3A313A|nr:polysaccharide deacetylase family protein [Heyndrickxia faecalis]MBQ4909932.1 polysaccharide deacetylase [Heyndrickxia faecalis]
MRGRKLNFKGKVVLALLFTLIVVVLTGLVGKGEKMSAKDKGKDAHAVSLRTLSFSPAPMTAFAGSPLYKSMIGQQRQQKEAERQKEVAKQNEKDLKENAIYLTFDDGPSSAANQLLDLLETYQMKATFFMLGPRMKEHPAVVKRMQKDGDGLALHGITHKARTIYSSTSAPLNEMAEDQRILENVAGVKSYMVRLPYGSIPYLTDEMRDLLDKSGFHIWDWNVDSSDWELKNGRYVQYTIQQIRQKKQAGETPVILLHDKPETVKYLPKLLKFIKKQGYKTKVLTNETPPVTFPCEGRCHPIHHPVETGRR